MKFCLAVATATCLLGATGAAQAQAPAYGGPSLLAVPDAAPPGAYYNQVAPTYAARRQGDMPPPVPEAPGWNEQIPGEPTPDDAWSSSEGCYEDAVTSNDYDMSYPGRSCCPWFGSLGVLYLAREDANTRLSCWVSAPDEQILSTGDAATDYEWGGEIKFGRRLGCQSAVEFTYWSAGAFTGYADVWDDTNDIGAAVPHDNVPIDGGFATDFFDNSRSHRISRHDELHNIELNFLRYPMACDPCSGFSMTWLAGFRFFRFTDSLNFGGLAGGADWGGNGGLDEAYLDVRTQNNLIGFQLGTRANCQLTERLSLYATPLVGIYGNVIERRTQLYRGDGFSAFDITNEKDDFAVIGQLDLGARFRIGRRASLFGAYRVMGVTGVALADYQTPWFLSTATDFNSVETDGGLMLHGAVFGLEFNY